MEISWHTKAYGWEGTLHRLNRDRNDYTKPRGVRRSADKAHQRIVQQLEDTKLMRLRGRLIQAAVAGDEREISRITKQMRDYTNDDQETGLYDT